MTTASIYLEDEAKPKIGDLSLVLDGRGEPACVIKTVYLQTVPFCDLTWDMVNLEGEDTVLKSGLPETEATGHGMQKGADTFLTIRRRFALKYLN